MLSAKSLPLVLAGPILRRTSAQEMWIWFALSSPIPTVKGYPALVAECYTAVNLPSITDMLIGSKANKSVGFGEIENATEGDSKSHIYCAILKNLHVYFVKISPSKKAKNQSFPLQELLCYELFFHEEVKVLKAGKTEDVVVRRGLHEHLYASKNYWKSQGVEKIAVPPGLRGFFAKDPKQYENWDMLATDAKSVFQYDRVWLRKYSKLWGVTDSTSELLLEGKLPITLIPSTSQEPHFWSGSCFKLHGKGESATFLMHDDRDDTSDRKSDAGELARAIAANRKRTDKFVGGQFPQALILTGDQIYADDIAFLLTDAITQFAELLGEEEELVAGENLKGLNTKMRSALTAKGNSQTPFSTNDVYNHVLTFAEYCAYHLMHMNAALWPSLDVTQRAIENYSSVKGGNTINALESIAEDIPALKSSRYAVRSYSTVQSCVPTYALCDDHDVTDDWFMDGEWLSGVLDPLKKLETRESVKHSEIGCRVIANAIGAYAVMHGIGNDPVHFKVRKVEARRFESKKDKTTNQYPEYARLLRILEWGDWSFDAPLSCMRAFCLDTRTTRIPARWLELAKQKQSYESDFYGASDTRDLDDWAMNVRFQRGQDPVLRPIEFDVLLYRDRVLNQLIERVVVSDTILLVTPSPVCSIDVIEERKQQLLKQIPGAGDRYTADAEHWRNNLSNFYRLFELLRRKGVTHCVVVSGDVHTAFRRNVEICSLNSDAKSIYDFKELEEKAPQVKFYQIVTSPLLNRNPSRLEQYGGSPEGIGAKYLKPSMSYITFSARPGSCIAVDDIGEWKKNGRKYQEMTIPIPLDARGAVVGKNNSFEVGDYYSFENNFASISIFNSSRKVEVKFHKKLGR